MKYYKLVEVLSNLNVKPPCTNVKPPAETSSPPVDDLLVTVLGQGRIQGGRSLPLKPTKVTLFTIISYNSENKICE